MSIRRLAPEILESLSGIETPGYDRTSVQPGVLHIGVGGFHRAHQAIFTEDAVKAAGGNWAIIGASLKTATAEQQLSPQDCLYTVNERTPVGTERRVVGIIRQIITASSSSGYEQLIEAIANPQIHVITLTVTEKGYCQNGGRLDAALVEIQQDLKTWGRKTTLPGVLAAGLERRRRDNGQPVTVLSCDNLMANGKLLARVIHDFISQYDLNLQDWVEAHVTFPCSMVDRIVPHTTDADRQALSNELGFADQAMTVCEPFKQWVIEDRFAGPRPAWESAGALFVDDVAPFEQAKLRLLNGTHSASAYLGLLSGYEFIHQVMEDEKLEGFLRDLVREEVQPMVDAPPGLDLDTYTQLIFDRFANSAVAYGTLQVATDGSQKLPQRLVPVVAKRLSEGLTSPKIATVFAAWLEHLKQPAPDPQGELLKKLAAEHHEPHSLVAAIAEHTQIFDELGEAGSSFFAEVAEALIAIRA